MARPEKVEPDRTTSYEELAAFYDKSDKTIRRWNTQGIIKAYDRGESGAKIFLLAPVIVRVSVADVVRINYGEKNEVIGGIINPLFGFRDENFRKVAGDKIRAWLELEKLGDELGKDIGNRFRDLRSPIGNYKSEFESIWSNTRNLFR